MTPATGHETDLDGYVRMGCPQCTNKVLYPEDNGFVPVCGRCDLRMQQFPIKHTTTPKDRSLNSETEQ